jgi:AAA ATPase domain/SEC-C motif
MLEASPNRAGHDERWIEVPAPRGGIWMVAIRDRDALVIAPPAVAFLPVDDPEAVGRWRMGTWPLDAHGWLARNPDRLAPARVITTAHVLACLPQMHHRWVAEVMRLQLAQHEAFAAPQAGGLSDEERSRCSSRRLRELREELRVAFPGEDWYTPVVDGLPPVPDTCVGLLAAIDGQWRAPVRSSFVVMSWGSGKSAMLGCLVVSSGRRLWGELDLSHGLSATPLPERTIDVVGRARDLTVDQFAGAIAAQLVAVRADPEQVEGRHEHGRVDAADALEDKSADNESYRIARRLLQPLTDAGSCVVVGTPGGAKEGELRALLGACRHVMDFDHEPCVELDGLVAYVGRPLSNDAASEPVGIAGGPVVLPLPRSLDDQGSSPFVGREAEVARLRECWSEMSSKTPAAVVVSGEPGIGKTRLMSEFARMAHEQGALVLYGRCDEELVAPYQAFVEALRPYAQAVGRDRLDAELGDLAPELGRVLPELAGLGDPVRGDPESERIALFEAIAALIETATRGQPALLIIDDLHCAPGPTLLLFRYLIRSQRSLGVLLLGIYRETAPDLRQPFAQLLADLCRDTNIERLNIGGLDEPAIAALLEATIGHALDERASELVNALAVQTAGNPFFLRELLAHIAEVGAISANDEPLSTSLTTARLEVPQTLQEVIGQRVARLSEPARCTLRVAAVAGTTFSFLLLERVLGESADVLTALDEAVAAGLLTEALHGDYVFVHALVRETIYEQLGAARRIRLHRQVGEALEALDPQTDIETLAHHFARAATDGQGAKAAAYALAAQRNTAADLDDEGTGPVHAAAVRPDGTTIATSSADGTVRLWEADTQEQLAGLIRPTPCWRFSRGSARANLGPSYGEAGRTKAVELGERVLADSERILGPEHPSMLTAWADLVGSYRSLLCNRPTPGRNDPCSCGSGKKYKRCHGR